MSTENKPAASASGKKKKGGRKALLLPLVCLGVWQLPYTVVLGLGFLPSGITWLVDRDRAKLTAITVAALNGAALTPTLVQVWDEGGTMSAALGLMANPLTWVLILLGVLAGWVFSQGVPALVVGVIITRERAQANRMRERQKQLIEEWGSAVAEGVDAPSSRLKHGHSAHP